MIPSSRHSAYRWHSCFGAAGRQLEARAGATTATCGGFPWSWSDVVTGPHGRPGGRRLPAVDEAAHVGRLADVLEVVGDDADQADPDGHRRVPTGVDDPLEPVVGDRGQVGHGGGVDVLEVVEEQVGFDDDQAHLGGIVPVAGVGPIEGKVEPFGPSAVQPALVGAPEVGDVVVLDPGEVPDQPGDGVGLGVRPEGQLLGGESVGRGVHPVPDPLEGVHQKFVAAHRRPPRSGPSVVHQHAPPPGTALRILRGPTGVGQAASAAVAPTRPTDAPSVDRAASSTSSTWAASVNVISPRTASGTSSRSGPLRSGSTTVVSPARWAANTFWRTPPMGSTRPWRVTSPVIPTAGETGRSVSRLTRAVVMVTPAEGPSFGTAPAGTWTWNRLPANTDGSIPSSGAWDRTKERAISADSRITSPSWPVMVRPSGPSIIVASTESTSPPAPVTASPVATPGTEVRSADSKKNRGRPSQVLTSSSSTTSGRGPGSSGAATRPATLRSSFPSSRSRERTPASRV